MSTIGIDLGTTGTVVSISKNGVPYALQIDGKSIIPSIVSYDKNGDVKVGYPALLDSFDNDIVVSVKRHMGSVEKIFEKTPEEISSEILKYVKKKSENILETKIDSAVITVPAHFSEKQRMATKHAASIAGIKLLRIINEPTAAAYAFGISEKYKSGIYAVYDFGGGTFDFSILRLTSDVFQVLATGGNNYLGGDDIDWEILNFNLNKNSLNLEKLTKYDVKNALLLSKIMKETLINKDYIERKININDKEYAFSLSKQYLEKILDLKLEQTINIAERVISDSKVSKLDAIIFVGGMTKSKYIREKIKNHFNIKVFDNINPDEAVSFGAALQAEKIMSNESGVLLIDVIPLSLGIETMGGGVDRILHRNTPIPISESREYTTYVDKQKAVKFNLVQGERALAKDCKSIGEFELSNISPMPAGVPKINVEFSVDINGLLHVTAKEKNNVKTLSVESSNSINSDEIIEILENAIEHRMEDESIAKEIKIKIDMDKQINFWQSIMKYLPDVELKNVEKLIAKINQKFEAKDIEKIKSIFAEHMEDIISKKLFENPISIERLKGEK